MNTLSRKQKNKYVGGDNRPRAHVNRPRGVTLCVGVPKGGPPTTSTSPTALKPAAHVEPPTSDPRDEARALAEFNAALQEAVNAEFGGAAF
jgi:hypothetical protein